MMLPFTDMRSIGERTGYFNHFELGFSVNIQVDMSCSSWKQMGSIHISTQLVNIQGA